MAAITYTARRSLVSGHGAGDVYSFDVALKQFDRAVKPVRNQARSLSGVTETLFHRNDVEFQVSTPPLNDAGVIAQMREFLDSVASGESFEIDVYGTTTTPAGPLTVYLDGEYQESAPAHGFISFSFRVTA